MDDPIEKVKTKTIMTQQDSNNYWEQLERLEKLIRAAELKAGIVFSFHSLILGLFVDKLEQLKPFFQESIILVIIAFLWMFSVMISIFYTFKCFKPQIELKYDKNVFFFRDAVYSFGGIREYTKRLKDVCSSDEIFEHLSQQIHVESKIIDQKFICVHRAIKFFALSIIFIIMALAYWLIIL